MAKYSVWRVNALFLSTLFLLLLLVNGIIARTIKMRDGSEEWGYVQVRPKAHMFWWLYKSPNRVDDPNKPWPIVLWLQGGPGGSGVGLGNFEEIGPLDSNLNPRKSTWLNKADLLFVDNPVGTGFSYVEDDELVVKTDEEAGEDLTRLLIKIFNKDVNLQKSPLYFVAESYGGKFAVTTALSALKAIQDGRLKLNLGGIALGDSWISPEDFVLSWGPLLKDLSRLDDQGMQTANSYAQKIKQQLENKQYVEATTTWSQLEGAISSDSNSVDFYNFMLDSAMDPIGMSSSKEGLVSEKLVFGRYSRYLNSMKTMKAAGGNGGSLSDLMDGPIRKKLRIIPDNVTWGGQSDLVFQNLEGDFMKPVISQVDELLSKGVNVTVYNGQVDLICATKGTQAWVEKLKWDGLKDFQKERRTPLYCGGDEEATKGFYKSYQNLHFYWILGAGHFVPVDQPCLALNMVGRITQSPATSDKSSTKFLF